jgi:hypothetical protein
VFIPHTEPRFGIQWKLYGANEYSRVGARCIAITTATAIKVGASKVVQDMIAPSPPLQAMVRTL